MGIENVRQRIALIDSTLSRRKLIIGGGALAAACVYGPGGLMRSAYAQAATFDYYIGPSGNDSNPGTSAQPWSIKALNSKRTTYAGKRVGLLDGTYRLIDILGQPTGAWNTNALVIAAGSAASPTVVQAVNLHGAIIDGQKSILASTAEAGLIGPGGSYVTIDGLKIINSNYAAISSISVGTYLTVKNCWFDNQIYSQAAGTGKNSATIFIQAQVGAILRNNRFENGGAPADGDRHSFMLFYNSTDCIVEYNTVTNIGVGGGNCLHFKATTDNKRMTVRNNYFNRTGSNNTMSKECIRWHGNSATDGYETCNNNVLVVGTKGSPFMGENASNTLRLYNNTLVGGGWNDDGGFNFLNIGMPTVNVYNNIFNRGIIGWQGDVRIPSLAKVGTMDYNLYDSNPALIVTDGNGATWIGLAVWQAASGKDLHSKQVADPLFVGTGTDAEKYKLQSGSLGKSLRDDGVEVGAWGGATQVGCSFTGPGLLYPKAPVLTVA